MKTALTLGSVPGHLWRLTAPMILAIIAHMSFNLVDTYFVSKLGSLELTAISFSFPVVMVLLNLSIGYGIGSTSVLSRMIGNQQNDLAVCIGSWSVLLMISISLLLCFLGILSIEPLFRLLGAQTEHIPYIEKYMIWAYPAMALRMIAIAISGLFKSNGITNIPSRAMLITAFINLALDPILIFGWGPIPALGIEGAGLATFLANVLAVAYEMYASIKTYHFLRIPEKLVPEAKESFRQIFSIGLPSSVANALNPLSISLGNYLLAQSTVAAVAGFGVATKIQAFFMIPILALSSATGPMIGQNFGAKDKARLSICVRWIFGSAILWGLVQSVSLYFLAEPLSLIFSDNKSITNVSTHYLQIIGFSLIGYSFVILTNSIMNASNKPLQAFVLIFFRTLGLFVPSYFILKQMSLEYPVLWSYFLANLLSLFLSSWSLKKFYEKHIEKM